MLEQGRLSFDQLQRRLVTTSPAKARELAARAPASYMAFDLLAVAGVDIRTQRWSTRRARLESLTDRLPPLQLSPVTYDVDEAQEWFDLLPGALGTEDRAVNGAASRYAPGRRDWLKTGSLGVVLSQHPGHGPGLPDRTAPRPVNTGPDR